MTEPLKCPPRAWSTKRDLSRKTHGPAVGIVAEALGTPLLPWQQYVADIAMEIDPETGFYVYKEIVLTLPRQQGKTVLELAIATHCALSQPGSRQVYTAQKLGASRKKLVDEWLPLIQSRPAFKGHVKPRLARGEEALLFDNGSNLGIEATTEISGHGVSALSKAFIDEAWKYTDSRVEQSFGFPLIANPMSQKWVVSTAGTYASTYLNAKIARGRAGKSESSAFLEWSADPEDDPTSVTTWEKCMPSLGHTIRIADVRAMLESMPLDEFRRGFLNITLEREYHESIYGSGMWEACQDRQSRITGNVAFAVEVAHNRKTASICVAGESAHGHHVELVDQRAGTDWVPERLAELVKQYKAVACVLDPGSPAGSLQTPCEKAGIKLTLVNTRDMVAASAALYDRVQIGNIRHLGQAELTAAANQVHKRKLESTWALERRLGDVAPIIAATLASWGLAEMAGRTEPLPDIMSTIY